MLKSDQMNMDQRFFKKVPVMMVIGKCYKNLELEFKNKNITISVDIPKEIEVDIQLDLFIQAIQNLFSNAIKFSHAGGTLRVDALQDERDTHIVIHDEGIGFDPAKAESLFDRFTKEGREGTAKEPSTGLGLYLVKKIVTGHKGKVSARSEGVDKGATFTIDLPRKKSSQETE
jgi:signal transduction histidine kinase